jgi:DNA-binding NtrC family response regulator
LTGVELAKKLREQRADIPLLLCTGYNDLRPDARDIERLFCEVVSKPYVVRSLAGAVRKAIDQGVAGSAG